MKRLLLVMVAVAAPAAANGPQGVVTYVWTTTSQGSGTHVDQPTIASFDVPLAAMLTGTIRTSDISNIQLAYPGLSLTSFGATPMGVELAAYVDPTSGMPLYLSGEQGLRIAGYQGAIGGDSFLSITFDAPAFAPDGQPLAGVADRYDAQNDGAPYSGDPTAGYWTAQILIIDPLVPEPTSWAMMTGGFGIVGGAMRRSKRSVRFA
jgi:hypothetical protein